MGPNARYAIDVERQLRVVGRSEKLSFNVRFLQSRHSNIFVGGNHGPEANAGFMGGED